MDGPWGYVPVPRCDRSGQRPNPCKDWVDESAWDSVTELDNLGAFSGFALSFEQVIY